MIETNRELYLAITGLSERQRETTRGLEEYLSSVWKLVADSRKMGQLSSDGFFALLSEGFSAPVPVFNEAWRGRYDADGLRSDGSIGVVLLIKMGCLSAGSGTGSGTFDDWENTILRQIVDLHEMREQGIMEDEQRYFGADSPRGERWYNLDPATFLECATVGWCGGWQQGDDSGRDYVPGPVAVLANDGSAESVDAKDIDNPISVLREITWGDFQNFLIIGQHYE